MASIALGELDDEEVKNSRSQDFKERQLRDAGASFVLAPIIVLVQVQNVAKEPYS